MTAPTRPAPSAAVEIGPARFGNELPLAVIAGPCVLESRQHALETAAALKEIAARLGVGLVYKTSFDKISWQFFQYFLRHFTKNPKCRLHCGARGKVSG